MTEQVMEGNQDGGAGGQPTQPVSGSPGVAPSSGAVTFESVLKKVADLESQVRGVQSAKDKLELKVSKELGDMNEQIAKYEDYKKEGMTKEQALRQMELDELLNSYRQSKSTSTVSPTESPGKTPMATSVEVQKVILAELGLSDNDPEVLSVFRENTSIVAQAKAFSELAEKRKTQAPLTPNPANIMTVGGGNVPRVDLEAEYRKEMEAARGQGASVGRQIKDKYRKKGLEVDKLHLA